VILNGIGWVWWGAGAGGLCIGGEVVVETGAILGEEGDVRVDVDADEERVTFALGA
jgi:hypothetical protein